MCLYLRTYFMKWFTHQDPTKVPCRQRQTPSAGQRMAGSEWGCMAAGSAGLRRGGGFGWRAVGDRYAADFPHDEASELLHEGCVEPLKLVPRQILKHESRRNASVSTDTEL